MGGGFASPRPPPLGGFAPQAPQQGAMPPAPPSRCRDSDDPLRPSRPLGGWGASPPTPSRGGAPAPRLRLPAQAPPTGLHSPFGGIWAGAGSAKAHVARLATRLRLSTRSLRLRRYRIGPTGLFGGSEGLRPSASVRRRRSVMSSRLREASFLSLPSLESIMNASLRTCLLACLRFSGPKMPVVVASLLLLSFWALRSSGMPANMQAFGLPGLRPGPLRGYFFLKCRLINGRSLQSSKIRPFGGN